MKLSVLNRLQELRAEKTPVAILSDLASGRQALMTTSETSGDLTITDAIREQALRRLRHDASGRLDQAADEQLFLQCHNPPLRLVIVGAVHIAQALAPVAAITGYEVSVIDPRRSFASPDRFPGVEVICDWPDEALERISPDARTAVITLTHDPKLDDPALHIALRSEAFYIGCLGSRRTHGLRLQRLHDAGFSEADTDRIHGPLGLPIGARSPQEIAISALSQVIGKRHKPVSDEG
ncbi:MAG: XdhC family protein [Rhodospirillales bacterium]